MNNNRDYVNYVTRHLETLNTIIEQMESINRNMYSLTTRPPSRNTRQPSSGLGAVGEERTSRRSSLSRQNFGNQSQNQTQNQPFRRGPAIPSERVSTELGNRNSTTTLSPLLSNVLARWFWDPVTVAPTQEEIDSATTQISFSELPETCPTCPITMETFTEESEILKINHCGHVFSKPAITRWFRNHVTCPVCRHDIRGQRAQRGPSVNVVDNETNNEVNTFQSSNLNEMRAAVQNPILAQMGQVAGRPSQTYQMDFVFDSPEGLNSFFDNVGLNNTTIASTVNDGLSLQTPSFYSQSRNNNL